MKNKCLQMQNAIPKTIYVLAAFLLLMAHNAYSQGAVYPLTKGICETTTEFTLEWTGDGTIENWQRNDGTGWSDIYNTNSSVTFGTPVPGTYYYRTYVDMGGGTYRYSNYSTVTVYAESEAGAGLNFSLTGNNGCESNNKGTIQFDNGYTGDIVGWVYSYDDDTPWQNIQESSRTLSFENLTENTYYKVKIQNGACPAVLSTNSALVSVVAAPSAGDISASDESICQGETVTLQVSGNTGAGVNWQYDNGGWATVGSGATYTTGELTSGTHNYRVQAYSSSCTDNSGTSIVQYANSSATTISTAANTSVSSLSGEAVVEYNDGTSNNITAAGSNGGVIRWEYSPDDLTWTSIANTSNTQSYQNLTSSRYYRVVNQNGTCAEAASSSVKITVASGGSITASNDEYCETSGSGSLTVSGHEGTSWSWERSVSPFTNWTTLSSNVNTYDFNNLTETTQFRVNVNNGKAYSDPVTINVYESSVAGSLSVADPTVCSGSSDDRTINLSGNTGDVVRWESSEHNGAPWNRIDETGTSLTYNNLVSNTYYRAIIQNGVCAEIATESTKITVAQGGSVAPDYSLCYADESISTLTLSDYEGIIERWESSEYNSVTQTWGVWTDIGNAGSSTYNFTGLTRSTRFRAVIESACDDDVVSDYAEVKIYESSVGGDLAGSKTTISGNNSGTLTLTGQVGDISRWESSTTVGGGEPWTVINNTSNVLTYTNLTQTTYYRAIVQNGPCEETASSNIATITIAKPGQVEGSRELCNEDPTEYTLSLEDYDGSIDRWERSTDGTTWSSIANTNGADSYTYSSLESTTYYRAVILEDTKETYSEAAVITVHQKPNVNFSATTACLNGSTVFSNNTTTSESFVLDTDWDFGDGNYSGALNPKHIYGLDSTYTVKLIVSTAAGCVDSLEKTVTVNPLPDVDFVTDDICDTKAMIFTNTSTLSGHTLTHSWDFGDGNTVVQRNPNHTYAESGDYTVKLVVEANTGCKDSVSHDVTVYPLPVPSFTVDNICYGDTAEFDNDSYVNTGNLSYQWDFDGQGSSTKTNPGFSFNGDGYFTVQLKATSQYGCVDSVENTISVYPMPVADFNATLPCHNVATEFSNLSTITDGELSYNWDYGNGEQSNETNPDYTYPNIGTYKVKLTTTSGYGCISTKEKMVEIYPVPQVNFAVEDVCNGDSIQLLNYSTITGGNMDYTWSFGDGNTTTETEPNHLYSQAGKYNIQLIAESNGNCADTLIKTVTVHENPESNFSVNIVCLNNVSQFTNQSSSNDGTVKSWDWDFGNGVTSSLENPNYTYSTADTFNVELITTTEYGCSNTLQKQAIVHPNPVAAFTQDNTCSNTERSFINTSVINGTGVTYSWDFGDNIGVSTETTPVYTYTTAGNYVVNLNVTNNFGCSNQTSSTVDVYERAIPNFSYSLACNGEDVEFTNETENAGSNYELLWTFNSGEISTNENPLYTFSDTGSQQVSLQVTTEDGCVDEVTQDVDVNPQPSLQFSVDNECFSDTMHFINQSSNLDQDISWSWMMGDDTSLNTRDVDYLYAASGTYLVNLTAVTGAGCTASVEKYVNVYANPKAAFSYTNACEGSEVSFTNLTSGIDGSLNYYWDFGNDNAATEESPTNLYNSDGTFNVTLIATSEYGCDDTITKTIDVYPMPDIDFNADAVCEGETSVFENKTTISTGNISDYLWDFGNEENSVRINPTYKYDDDGEYDVSLTATSDKGCRSILEKVVAVHDKPQADFYADAVCIGNEILFSNQSSVSNGDLSYTWTLEDDSVTYTEDPVYLYESAGDYSVQLIAREETTGCADTLEQVVTVNPLPKVSAGTDTTINRGYPLTLQGSGALGDYNWLPESTLSNAFILDPDATPLDTTDYVLTITDENGCVNSDTVRVNVNVSYSLYGQNLTATNIISPDGNGLNDTWVIENIDMYEGNHVAIYSRWGTKVFEAKDYQNDWDGTNEVGDPLPDGTYYYVIYFDGSNVVHKGAITLIKDL